MEIKIERAWNFDIKEYETILNKYNVRYVENADKKYYDHAFIKINNVGELFVLAKEIGYGIIISSYYEIPTLLIHDDYIE